MQIRHIYPFLIVLAFVNALAIGLAAQSTSQDFPTPIISSEISGTIKARDVGDSRLTTYYYALNGEQGDLFVNLVTRNFTGDIDIFTVNGLRPMTKIVVYADYAETETGRAIYLRKSEKLILRVQGRTPNDEAAAFTMKFAGSFVAARPEDAAVGPDAPKVSSTTTGSVRVNSVGTILPAPPRLIEPTSEKREVEVPAQTEEIKTAETENATAAAEPKQKPSLEIVVMDPVKTDEKVETSSTKRPSTRRTPVRRPKKEKVAEVPETGDTAQASEDSATARPPLASKTRRTRQPKKTEPPAPDPLASINLVIQFKDGNSLEKKMSEVFKFSVDKGVLTVILKDGGISRYPIVDVAKVTIE